MWQTWKKSPLRQSVRPSRLARQWYEIVANSVYSVRQKLFTLRLFSYKACYIVQFAWLFIKKFPLIMQVSEGGALWLSGPSADCFTVSIGRIYCCSPCMVVAAWALGSMAVPLFLAGCCPCMAWQTLFQVEEISLFQGVWLTRG